MAQEVYSGRRRQSDLRKTHRMQSEFLNLSANEATQSFLNRSYVGECNTEDFSEECRCFQTDKMSCEDFRGCRWTPLLEKKIMWKGFCSFSCFRLNQAKCKKGDPRWTSGDYEWPNDCQFNTSSGMCDIHENLCGEKESTRGSLKLCECYRTEEACPSNRDGWWDRAQTVFGMCKWNTESKRCLPKDFDYVVKGPDGVFDE